MNLLSHDHWMLFVSILTGGTAGVWFVLDAVRLARRLPRDRRLSDHVFGYVIGVVVGLIGVAGVARFYLE